MTQHQSRKAVPFDTMQYLFEETGFHDHQVHAVIHFDDAVDAEAMARAVMLLMETVPLLSSRYHHDGGDDSWEPAPYTLDDVWSLAATNEAFQRFVTSRTDEANGPQLRACLGEDGHALAATANHMVCDAIGFKQLLYLLAAYYTGLRAEAGYVPGPLNQAERGCRDVLGATTLRRRLAILRGLRDLPWPGTAALPLGTGSDAAPFILVHTLPSARYGRLLAYCAAERVSVNDVLLTAYHRALAATPCVDGEPADVPIMVDMRRYLRSRATTTIDNLTSTANTRIDVGPGETFTGTLGRVHTQMDHLKRNLIGMDTVVWLWSLARRSPRKRYEAIRQGLRNPNLCMTNIGVIDAGKLTFAGTRVQDAVVTNAIKYRPHVQVAASLFRDRLTFSTNLYGDAHDQDTLRRLHAAIDAELPGRDPADAPVPDRVYAGPQR